MTLALYGKTRRRQSGLLFAGFMAVMVALLGAIALGGGSANAAASGELVSPTANDGGNCEDEDNAHGLLGGVTTCTDGEVVVYHTFNYAVPAGKVITGVQVQIVHGTNNNFGDDGFSVSVHNGTSYSTARNLGTEDDSSPYTETDTSGADGDLWGLTWNVAGANAIKVRLQAYGSTILAEMYLNSVQVAIFYADPPPDDDNDGVPNSTDQCPATTAGETVYTGAITGSVGCSLNDVIGELKGGTSNPGFATDVCESANFSFVIDRSGSISGTESAAMRDAIVGAGSFTNTYETNGGVGAYKLTTFAGTTAASAGGYQALGDAGSGFTQAINTALGVAGSGTTPTAAGITTGDSPNGGGPGKNIMFVVTDGSPNRATGQPSTDTGNPQTWIYSANAAITAADAARANFNVLAVWIQSTDSMPFNTMFPALVPSANEQFAQAVMNKIGGGSSYNTTTFEGVADQLLASLDCQAPTLTIDKEDAPQGGPYGVGDEFDWVVKVTVTGGSTLTTHQITDVWDHGKLQFVSATPSASISGCSDNGAMLTCTLAQGAGAGDHTVTVRLKVLAAGECSEIRNLAGIRQTPTSPYIDEDDGNVQTACPPPTSVIQVCKVWAFDQVGELSDGTTTFLIDVSDTQEVEAIPVDDVTEGDQTPECELVEVNNGLVRVTEQGPLTGFNTPTWATSGISGLTDGTGYGPVSFWVDSQGCSALQVTAPPLQQAIENVTHLSPTADVGVACTITFRNTDLQNRLPSGNLRIEKYLDINGDGDANDPGEGLLDNWPILIAGSPIAGAYETGQGANPFGTLVFDGLDAGNLYTITEQLLAGYTVSRATRDGVNLGAVTQALVSIPDGGTTVVRFFNTPRGGISVNKATWNTVNNISTQNLNDDDGWKITVASAACGINQTKDTDANGNAVFDNLPLCSDYVVSENTANQPAPGGYSAVGSASVSGVTPTLGGHTQVNFINETKTSTTPVCTVNCGPSVFPSPTPTTVPPTATAVPPTPTQPGGAQPTPATAIAGERTPGASPTPVAPSTGNGSSVTAAGFNLLLVAAGLVALTGGLSFLAMGRKRR